ncbi:nucleotidyltransferase [Paenibacillus alginolyticus]|uniref:Nucleotidyltransferase n=1 Tax=Paenibacillus alginolyticus TaxID=59839 RepID=A0ABT4G7Q9_9BACL|nr:nucleotidyltransferase [Paenibacillus alginolyticus]MCY9692222.1 nucleotidyltransferase [Paenibacillus alginolyticus]MEC0145939.1 nucleotidyltransferase [Paenibacillus alginolyticus]
MPSTVNTAFSEFMRDTVNLDTVVTSTAQSSRDWLVDQIDKFDSKEGFPTLYNDIDIHFGSFARRTKIRELDDIDLIIGLNAQGSTYLQNIWGTIEMTVPDTAGDLTSLCHDYTKKLNSRKVINKFVSELKTISQYKNSEIKRNQEAATLELKTYSWTFDIVPSFITSAESDGRTFYLIPDGNGHWKKTDPRIDRDNISRINQKHNGKILNAIRLMKYWNKRAAMPTISSYLLECIILSYYDSKLTVSDYIDIEARSLFGHLSSAIYNDVYDPKNIQGNLNKLTYDEKQKISTKSLNDYNMADEALSFETSGNHKSAINKWRGILGDSFPEYTE